MGSGLSGGKGHVGVFCNLKAATCSWQHNLWLENALLAATLQLVAQPHAVLQSSVLLAVA